MHLGTFRNFLKVILGNFFFLKNIFKIVIPWLFDFARNLWFQYQYLYPSLTSEMALCLSVNMKGLYGLQVVTYESSNWLMAPSHHLQPFLPPTQSKITPSVHSTAMSSQQAETPHRPVIMLPSITDIDIEWTANRTRAAGIPISAPNVWPLNGINNPRSRFPSCASLLSYHWTDSSFQNKINSLIQKIINKLKISMSIHSFNQSLIYLFIQLLIFNWLVIHSFIHSFNGLFMYSFI